MGAYIPLSCMRAPVGECEVRRTKLTGRVYQMRFPARLEKSYPCGATHSGHGESLLPLVEVGKRKRRFKNRPRILPRIHEWESDIRAFANSFVDGFPPMEVGKSLFRKEWGKTNTETNEFKVIPIVKKARSTTRAH